MLAQAGRIVAMVMTMDQSLTLGAYAATVTAPLVRAHGEPETLELVLGLIHELWAGLPLVYHTSYVDTALPDRDPDRTLTVRESADGAAPPQQPSDLVPDSLDLVRTVWQLARQGNPAELATVARFRLADLAAAMDHLYAQDAGLDTPSRPGAFEAVVRECLDIIAAQPTGPTTQLLSDSELYEHATTVGRYLVECLDDGHPCDLLTTPHLDLLRLQVMSALSVAGLAVIDEVHDDHAGVLLVVVDDVDLTSRNIELHWHCSADLRERCREALRVHDLGAEALRQSGRITITMSRAVRDILRDAGFEAAIDLESGEHHVVVTRLREPEQLRCYVSTGVR